MAEEFLQAATQRRQPMQAARRTPLGVRFGDRDRVRIGDAPGVDAHETARLDDPVEGRPVDDEILDHRKRPGPPRLDRDGVAVAERPHVQLACRDAAHRAVPPVDVDFIVP
jgi:hypothetical protein